MGAASLLLYSRDAAICSNLICHEKRLNEEKKRLKFFHLSDLHIGKLLNGYSLRESQSAALSQIVDFASSEKPDAVLICGDIYDKPAPSAEAVSMFDRFLTELSETCPGAEILMIAGNHDSPERLSYGASFLEQHRIHISASVPADRNSFLKKVTLEDEWGPVHFYLCPFFRPGHVRHLTDREISGYTEACQFLLSRETISSEERNVILAHQFFVSDGTDPERCDSETAVLTSGGLDQISSAVLEAFDYSALGHLHGPQKVGRESCRYCGTPYKYSVSEEYHRKGITVVEMGPKGSEPQIRRLPLCCRPEVRRLKGTLAQLEEWAREAALQEGSEDGRVSDFVSLTLTDETERFDFRERLEAWYSHILEIRIDNSRTRQRLREEEELPEILTPMAAFRSFFETVRHETMTAEQERIMERIVEEAEEEERI